MSKEKINLMIEGGKATAGAELGQKLGPLRINIQDVLKEINENTESFKGMQVPVKLSVDTVDKSFSVEVGSPPVSQLLKKETGLEKGSGEPHLTKVANLGMEQIIKIAKMKQDSMIVNNLKAAVNSVVGTCNSLGILVEGKEASAIVQEVKSGIYDNLINTEASEISSEKKAQLASQLTEIQSLIAKEQEKLKALQEAEKPTVAIEAVPAEEKKEEVKEDKKEDKKDKK